MQELAEIQSKIKANKGLKGLNIDSTYQSCNEVANRLSLHYLENADKIKAKEFLKEKAPNQTQVEFDYELDNFRVWSRRILLKLIGGFANVANPKSYTISIEDQPELNDYLQKDYPTFGSYKNYVNQFLLNRLLLDANSVRVTKPLELPYLFVDGELVLDDSKPIEAVDEVFESKRSLYYKENKIFIGVSNENSLVEYANRTENTGIVLEIYTPNEIYKVYQIGKKIDYDFSEPLLYYKHDLGYLPAMKLKGLPEMHKSQVIYYSPLNYVTDELDTYLKYRSNLNVGILNRVFSERVEATDKDCPTCAGSGQTTAYSDERQEEILVTCKKCKGSGALKAPSQTSTKYVKYDPDNPDKNSFIFPGVSFVSPSVEPLDFLQARITEEEENIYKTLNQKVTQSIVNGKESQTATGESIDREDRYAVLQLVASNLFDNVKQSIKAHVDYYTFNEDVSYKVTEPISFSIRNEQDLINELNSSEDLSPSIKAEIYEEYVMKRFAENEPIRIYNDVIRSIDRLYGLSSFDKSAMVAEGSAYKWEKVLSDSILFFISQVNLTIQQAVFLFVCSNSFSF